MGEAGAIARSDQPSTVRTLTEDLRAIGLGEGALILVHSSLSAVGWIAGGAVALTQALLDVVGPGGTVVMPTQSGDLSDPAEWRNPPVPEAWVESIRAEMPAYDPRLTPARGMGVVPELFRHWPGAVRSDHPHVSFAALGPDARVVTADHLLASSLGEQSPLARLYDRDAQVLLLGVGYDSCTAFHLAEYRTGGGKPVRLGAPVMKDGRREWTWFEDIELRADVFAELGADFEREQPVRRGRIGAADSRLFSLPAGVDFAVDWLRARGR